MAILLKVLSFTIWLVIMLAIIIGSLRSAQEGFGDGEEEVKMSKETPF